MCSVFGFGIRVWYSDGGGSVGLSWCPCIKGMPRPNNNQL